MTRVTALLLFLFLTAGAAQAGDVLRCGQDMRLETTVVPLPVEKLTLRKAAPQITGTTITLVAGPGLQAQPDALAAWQRAVDAWEAVLHDNVNVILEGDLASMGEQVLGATDFRIFDYGYDEIRNAMVADAQADEALLSGLPTGAELSVVLSPFWLFGGSAVAKANLRALGYDVSFDDPFADGTITFNSDFLSLFDFDASDGIDSTLYDFEAIVTHEIGHALGFYSIVDQVDVLVSLGVPGGALMTPLDHFRMRPGDGASDFTLNPRVLADGTTEPSQVSYDGSQDLAMSTGVQVGDGNQASHWKADELTAVHIGMMDPTLAAGDRQVLTENDIRVMGLIGWDVSATIGVGENLPLEPVLHVAPNPFQSHLAVTLVGDGPVSLSIVDATGRRVHTWAGGLNGERTQVVWDGRDAQGRQVASGVYYLVYETPSYAASIPVVRIK